LVIIAVKLYYRFHVSVLRGKKGGEGPRRTAGKKTELRRKGPGRMGRRKGQEGRKDGRKWTGTDERKEGSERETEPLTVQTDPSPLPLYRPSS
jgi:hypothetical protein